MLVLVLLPVEEGAVFVVFAPVVEPVPEAAPVLEEAPDVEAPELEPEPVEDPDAPEAVEEELAKAAHSACWMASAVWMSAAVQFAARHAPAAAWKAALVHSHAKSVSPVQLPAGSACVVQVMMHASRPAVEVGGADVAVLVWVPEPEVVPEPVAEESEVVTASTPEAAARTKAAMVNFMSVVVWKGESLV